MDRTEEHISLVLLVEVKSQDLFGDIFHERSATFKYVKRSP